MFRRLVTAALLSIAFAAGALAEALAQSLEG